MKPAAAALAALFCLAGPAPAEEDAASIAERASDLLGQAALSLSEAKGSGAEIRALTETVRAYELGLSALREGARRAAIEERAARADLADRAGDLGAVLVVLTRQSRLQTTETLLHPGSAPDRVRAGLILGQMTPDLDAEVSALRAIGEEIAALSALQDAAVAQLEDGAAGIRSARTALAGAVAGQERRPTPTATDAAAMEALINSAETLAAFADSLAESAPGDFAATAPWDWPVEGTLRSGFGAGLSPTTRQGWVIGTAEGAIVTAPAPATVRFAGDIPGQPGLAILETAPGELLILGGLGDLFVDRGQIVSARDPIGLMPGADAAPDQKLIDSSFAGGQHAPERLYIELRRRQAPIDPAVRFREATQEG